MEAVDFDVELKPVYTEDGLKIPRRKAVVRTDMNRVIGLVSDNYKLVHHRKVLETFDSVEGMERRKLDVCRDGGVMFAHYDLKANGTPGEAEVQVGDVVSFGLRAFNSYDLTHGLGFELVAERLVCKNGLIAPTTMTRLSLKHFEGANVEMLKGFIQRTKDRIPETVETWKRWTNIHPTPDQIAAFFEELKMGKKDKDRLAEASLGESDRLGVWGVFNVLTRYITHEMKVKNARNRMLAVRNKERDLLQKVYKYDWVNN